MNNEKLNSASKIVGVILFLAGIAAPAGNLLKPALFFAAWLIIGHEVIFRAAGNLLRGKVFDENFLMTIATVGAFAIGEYPEAAAVMLFYEIGEAFQEAAVRRSRKSITSLMDLRPDYAWLRRETPGGGTEVVRVSPDEVRPGDAIVVKPGEKIPLDGTVIEGETFLDTQALTGESVPRRASAGTEVLSGMVNQTSLIAVAVSKVAGESAAARILKLVSEAEAKKAPAETFIARFARCYTPAVVFGAAALALFPPLAIIIFKIPACLETAALFAQWLRRALVFLVVSCPCALVVSVPLTIFAGLGSASRRGILVKGGSSLDALTRAGTAVFDKTGTLTRGAFSVAAILPAGADDAAPDACDALLAAAALAESNSNHPIALSIKAEAEKRGLLEKIKIENGDASYSEYAGKGVRVTLGARTLFAGSRTFLAESGIKVPGTVSASGTEVSIAENGIYIGRIVIADELKADAPAAIAALKQAGIKTVMLSGDGKAAADDIARRAGVDEWRAELLPWEKVEQIEEMLEAAKTKKGKNKIVFSGDGINDAPALARADVGIAMGGLGSDAAIESADVVLMTDEMAKIPEAISVARHTGSIVMQNIVFSLAVKAALLVLGALGMASLWAAVFGDVGVALLAVLNATRAYARH